MFCLRTGVSGNRFVAVVDGAELAKVPTGAAAGAKVLVDDVRSLRSAGRDALLGAVTCTHGATLAGVRVDAKREVAVQRSMLDRLRSSFLGRGCLLGCGGSGRSSGSFRRFRGSSRSTGRFHFIALVDGAELTGIEAGTATDAGVLIDLVRLLDFTGDGADRALTGTGRTAFTLVGKDADGEVGVELGVLRGAEFRTGCGSSGTGTCGGSCGFRSGSLFGRSGRLLRKDVTLIDGVELTGLEAGTAADALVLSDLMRFLDFALDGADRAGTGTGRTAAAVVRVDLDFLIVVEVGRGSSSGDGTGCGSAFGSGGSRFLGRSFIIRVRDHFDDIERAGFRADTAADAVFFPDEFRKRTSHTTLGDRVDEVECVDGAVEETALTAVTLRIVDLRDLFRVSQRKTPPQPYS